MRFATHDGICFAPERVERLDVPALPRLGEHLLDERVQLLLPSERIQRGMRLRRVSELLRDALPIRQDQAHPRVSALGFDPLRVQRPSMGHRPVADYLSALERRCSQDATGEEFGVHDQVAHHKPVVLRLLQAGEPRLALDVPPDAEPCRATTNLSRMRQVGRATIRRVDALGDPGEILWCDLRPVLGRDDRPLRAGLCPRPLQRLSRTV